MFPFQTYFKDNAFINPKLLHWNDEIKTNFHGKKVPFSKSSIVTCILKLGNIYKWGDS